MRFLFVYWKVHDGGSAQDIRNYLWTAKRLGHQAALYLPDEEKAGLSSSIDIESADLVIFVLESNIYSYPGEGPKDYRARAGLMGMGQVNLARMVSKVPKGKRLVIDCDGMYNDAIRADGDYNHPDPEASQRRVELCDSLADRILQPTFRPLRPNVRTFFFHAYNPAWERPLDFTSKEYGMFYVGNNWFRWHGLHRVLRALEPIRGRVGRIGLVGRDWDAMPWWVESPLREAAYYTDPAYLKKLDVDILPPVPVEHVIGTMSKAIFNPVLVRPLFDHLGLVTCRTFETPAANTVPLFAHNAAYVKDVYGECALELALPEDASKKIADVLERPHRYARIVADVRRHLAEKHSYADRLRDLLEIMKS